MYMCNVYVDVYVYDNVYVYVNVDVWVTQKLVYLNKQFSMLFINVCMAEFDPPTLGLQTQHATDWAIRARFIIWENFTLHHYSALNY